MTRYEAPLTTGSPPETRGIRDADVVVLGLGPGGEDAAIRLARAGLAVIAVEDRLVGGECPYWGCIPSKMMIRAASLLTEGRRIPGLAGDSAITPSWAPSPGGSGTRPPAAGTTRSPRTGSTAAGVALLRGHGTITGPREVTVNRARSPSAARAAACSAVPAAWCRVPRLREMIYAYPAFHRAVESALDVLAGQDGPYS